MSDKKLIFACQGEDCGSEFEEHELDTTPFKIDKTTFLNIICPFCGNMKFEMYYEVK